MRLANRCLGEGPVVVVIASADTDETTIDAARNVRDIVGRKRLRELMARRDGPGLVFLAGHVGLLGVTGALLWMSLGTPWVVATTFLHGIVIVHFFAPFHECTHYTAFKSRWLNTAVAWFTGLVLMLPPLVFRYAHADHHTYTQNIRRDPQMIPMGETLPGYLYYASSIPYFISNLGALVNQTFGRLTEEELRAVPESARSAVQREAVIFWAVYLGLAGISLWLGTWAVVIYWLIPRFVGEPVMRIIRMSEHVGCARVPDMLQNSRTVEASAPVRWLAWNMPYHTAHHAAPQVPFHALPDLNAVLRDHTTDVRHGYIDAVRFQVRNAMSGGVA